MSFNRLKKHLPSLLFLLAAALWGFAFPVQKNLTALPVFTTGSIRYILAAAFLFIVIPIMDKVQKNGRHLFCPQKISGGVKARRFGLDFNKTELFGGFVTGCVLVAASRFVSNRKQRRVSATRK